MTAPRPGANFKAKDGEPFKFAVYATMYENSDCLLWPFAKSAGYGCLHLDGIKQGFIALCSRRGVGLYQLLGTRRAIAVTIVRV